MLSKKSKEWKWVFSVVVFSRLGSNITGSVSRQEQEVTRSHNNTYVLMKHYHNFTRFSFGVVIETFVTMAEENNRGGTPDIMTESCHEKGKSFSASSHTEVWLMTGFQYETYSSIILNLLLVWRISIFFSISYMSLPSCHRIVDVKISSFF